jgi:hypothetical protein
MRCVVLLHVQLQPGHPPQYIANQKGEGEMRGAIISGIES